MKFIVDAQLPKSVSDFLKLNGFDSIHTLDLPDKNRTTDKKIIEISNIERRVVITKDSDFLYNFLINYQPEKLIFIRTGNIENSFLINIISLHLTQILSSLLYHSLIEINQQEMIVHQ